MCTHTLYDIWIRIKLVLTSSMPHCSTTPRDPPPSAQRAGTCNTNPDLVFSKHSPQEAMPVRRILDRFPRSHHRPSLITTPSLIQTIGGRPVLRWNFRKAKWDDFENAVNASAENLPLPTRINLDDAYSA